MKLAIINSSAVGIKGQSRYPIYNLGAERIASYHTRRGDEVVYTGSWDPMLVADAMKIYFSVIFTWDVPELIRQVNLVRTWGAQVEIGGPAATFLAKYIEARTGVRPHKGLDERFEHAPGEYKIMFSSRGCPQRCAFCGVRRVEPQSLVYDEFQRASIVGDNNILATPMAHQEKLVEALKDLREPIDFNSGFDVRLFNKRHFELYSRLRLKYWRFAFDSMAVEKYVRRVGEFMRVQGLDRHKVTFYCLVGFPGQTLEECLYRLNLIIELGHNPYPQRFYPLNSLDRTYVAPGWTENLLYRLTQYYQAPYNWRSEGYKSFEDFYPGKPKTFAVTKNQGCLFQKLDLDCL